MLPFAFIVNLLIKLLWNILYNCEILIFRSAWWNWCNKSSSWSTSWTFTFIISTHAKNVCLCRDWRCFDHPRTASSLLWTLSHSCKDKFDYQKYRSAFIISEAKCKVILALPIFSKMKWLIVETINFILLRFLSKWDKLQ